MKKVKNELVKSISGGFIKIPEIDDAGEFVTDSKGVPNTVDGRLSDLIRLLVLQHPRQGMTQADAIHGARLYGQVMDSDDDVLCIEDAEHAWLVKKLESDFAAQILGMNMVFVQEAAKNLVEEDKPEKSKRGK